MSDLVQSILAHGLLQPPLVARQADGSLVIIAGHRRVRACQLLALEGKLPDEKIRVFVRSELTEHEIEFLICTEALHRRGFSAVHEAQVVGRTWLTRSHQLGRDATTDDLVDLIPPGRTSISDALTVFRALDDPRLGPLVRAADEAGKTLLVKALRAREFSTSVRALEAYQQGGVPAMKKALSSSRGRPKKTVTRAARGKDEMAYDLTIRVRPGMPTEAVSEAEAALRGALADLETIRESQLGAQASKLALPPSSGDASL